MSQVKEQEVVEREGESGGVLQPRQELKSDLQFQPSATMLPSGQGEEKPGAQPAEQAQALATRPRGGDGLGGPVGGTATAS